MPAPSTTEDDSGDWDGDEGRQTAFCNSVNVRMEKVSWTAMDWMGEWIGFDLIGLLAGQEA